MTEDQINRLLDLEAKATSGDWDYDYYHESQCDFPDNNCEGCGYLYIHDKSWKNLTRYEGIHSVFDAKLIAESRNLIKDLCLDWKAKNEKLKKAVEALDIIVNNGGWNDPGTLNKGRQALKEIRGD